MPNERGQVRVKIGGYFIARLLEEGYLAPSWQIVAGLPPNARYVRCYDDPQVVGTMVLVFEHESFPQVPHGNVIPIKDVEIVDVTEGVRRILH